MTLPRWGRKVLLLAIIPVPLQPHSNQNVTLLARNVLAGKGLLLCSLADWAGQSGGRDVSRGL